MNEYLEQARVRESHEDQRERALQMAEDDQRRAREIDRADFRGPDWKPAKRVRRSNMPRPDRLWRERVLERDQGCIVHDDPAYCADGFQAHHVVTQQELYRHIPEQRRLYDVLWNPLSGVGVCTLAHRQHHNRTRPIEYDELPIEVLDYLSGLGFALWIERHYPAPGRPLRDAKP